MEVMAPRLGEILVETTGCSGGDRRGALAKRPGERLGEILVGMG